MSKQASKSLIGAFVLGSIFLGVAGIVVFGSGKLFTEAKKSVMFFGLGERAPDRSAGSVSWRTDRASD